MHGSSDIDEVKQRANIIDVVSRYVALQKRGSAWKGLCPFHNEKTPSFTVNPDTGRWHCFGTCAEGGDVIRFVMKIENLSFREALERLANQYNVTLTKLNPADSAQAQVLSSKRDRAYRACDVAAKFYLETLSNSALARNYLTDRGFGHEVLSAFKVGYAGADWDALPRYLTKNGVSMEDALTAGVVMANDYGGYRDKFGERIIFPIVDVEERVVAFGGRLMETIEGRPKYLNSAETPIFVKSRQLYGLWRARRAIAAANLAIVVEGYLDVIACHQAGIQNAIATLGTALTEDHASVLSRHAKRIILAFDADAAGVKAAQKAAAIFAPREMDVRMLALPDGEDPDSMLKAGKEVELNRAIQSALPVTEFYLRRLVIHGTARGMADADREALMRNQVLPILRSITGIVERERHIRICAPLHPHFSAGSAYAEEQIRQELDGRSQQRPQTNNYDRPKWNPNNSSGKRGGKGQYSQQPYAGVPQSPIPPPANIREACERILRAVVVGSAELRAAALDALKPADLVPSLQGIWTDILGGEDPIEVMERYGATDPEIANLLARLTVEPGAESAPITDEGLRGDVAYILGQQQDEYENQLKIRMEAGDSTAVAEYQELKKRRIKSPWSIQAAQRDASSPLA